MPARSAGPPGWTPRMTTPSVRASDSALATSAVTGVGSMPSQPRVTSPSRDDLLEHVARERDGNRERDAERPARLREDRAVDADQVAGGVDERAAGVAGIDRGVGLDEILEAVDAEIVAAERAHDAERHRVAEAERIADREHDVADLQVVRVRERHRGQILVIRLQHREVGFRIGAAHVRRQAPAVRQHELDVVGALDHVMIGEHVAFATRRSRRSPGSSAAAPALRSSSGK